MYCMHRALTLNSYSNLVINVALNTCSFFDLYKESSFTSTWKVIRLTHGTALKLASPWEGVALQQGWEIPSQREDQGGCAHLNSTECTSSMNLTCMTQFIVWTFHFKKKKGALAYKVLQFICSKHSVGDFFFFLIEESVTYCKWT